MTGTSSHAVEGGDKHNIKPMATGIRQESVQSWPLCLRMQSLKGEKWRCVHNILRIYPCDKCAREESECAAYRHPTEEYIRQLLMDAEVTRNPKDALALAKVILEGQRPHAA
jgi:hypothetical protein